MAGDQCQGHYQLDTSHYLLLTASYSNQHSSLQQFFDAVRPRQILT